MRRLIYVPIIHTSPDLGELAEGFEERAKAVAGKSEWQEHQEAVRRYWQEIAAYWQEKDISGLKIFQDGMMADGVIGVHIVKSLADQGSINYTIIQHMMEQGAKLMKTEDPELLKEEYYLTRELVKKKSLPGTLWTLFRYRLRKGGLLRARDAYIAKSIAEGLAEGETGVCFLGAYHHILPRLPKDIEVATLKDPEEVRRLSQNLTNKR